MPRQALLKMKVKTTTTNSKLDKKYYPVTPNNRQNSPPLASSLLLSSLVFFFSYTFVVVSLFLPRDDNPCQPHQRIPSLALGETFQTLNCFVRVKVGKAIRCFV